MAITPQLTVAAQTATQTSAYFNRPRGVAREESMLISFQSTAGSTLDLTLQLEAQAANGDWILWALDTFALTGVSNRVLLVSPKTQTDLGTGVNRGFVAPIPETMRFVVTHGNANEATYTVTADFF